VVTPVPTRAADGPLARCLAEWRLLVPFAGRALALQGSHPTVAAGIYQHSDIFKDPWRRAQRTFFYAQRILFGADREATAREVRELHRHIKGTGFDGKPYHAWNRQAWTWVHLTSFEATIFSLEKIHGPLPADDIEALYDDAKAVGELYGVRPQDMPDDIAGLHDYVEEGVETLLTHKPLVELVPSLQHLPPPFGLPVPTPVWELAILPVTHPAHIVLAGSFPPTIRKRWGIRWSIVHELEYQAQIAALRALGPLPDRLRMLPYPYRALQRATVPSLPSD
jgi:uncharacterized protein (DUF2236 family)